MSDRLADLEPFAQRFMLEQGRGRLRGVRVLGARVVPCRSEESRFACTVQPATCLAVGNQPADVGPDGSVSFRDVSLGEGHTRDQLLVFSVDRGREQALDVPSLPSGVPAVYAIVPASAVDESASAGHQAEVLGYWRGDDTATAEFVTCLWAVREVAEPPFVHLAFFWTHDTHAPPAATPGAHCTIRKNLLIQLVN